MQTVRLLHGRGLAKAVVKQLLTCRHLLSRKVTSYIMTSIHLALDMLLGSEYQPRRMTTTGKPTSNRLLGLSDHKLPIICMEGGSECFHVSQTTMPQVKVA